ncbi:unnamed protein product, partial [marine sediment metagenome]
KEWRNNPFHNHFVYVDADTPDSVIKQLMTESLEEFYGIWAENEDILKAWKERPLKSKRGFVAGDLSDGNIESCQRRVQAIRNQAIDFEVRKI